MNPCNKYSGKKIPAGNVDPDRAEEPSEGKASCFVPLADHPLDD